MTQHTTRVSLLQRLASPGNDEAWAEFHRHYGGLIVRVARSRGLSVADADDVLQDVLMKLTGAMPGFTYDPARGRFRGYLRTVVVHAIADRFRQKRPIGPVHDHEAIADDRFDAVWEDAWREHHVRRAMERIASEFSERDRAAFTLTALQGQNAATVAETLSCTTDQVYQARSRITRRLRAIVEAQVAEEG